MYRFMASTEFSERKRLAPVICTILKLTSTERKIVDQAILTAVGDELDPMASIGAFTSSLGSFFGASSSQSSSSVP